MAPDQAMTLKGNTTLMRHDAECCVMHHDTASPATNMTADLKMTVDD